MARFTAGLLVGAAFTLIGLAALGAHAATEGGAGDDEVGVASGVPDTESPPTPEPAPTYSAAIIARVQCIETKESGGQNIANLRGSGAGGVLQYMAPTFTAHASELGHPEWSRWNPDQARTVAAHDLVMGRRSQWTVAGC